jgi:hypothetical protein
LHLATFLFSGPRALHGLKHSVQLDLLCQAKIVASVINFTGLKSAQIYLQNIEVGVRAPRKIHGGRYSI